MPNLVKQQKALIAFMSAGVKDAAPFGDCYVAHADGKVACAAIWLPPGTYPRAGIPGHGFPRCHDGIGLR